MTTTDLELHKPLPMTDDERATLRSHMCDACGTSLIPSAARVTLASGKLLYMCNHHAQINDTALYQQGATVER